MMFRNIVERSVMTNNDEVVFYSEKELSFEQFNEGNIQETMKSFNISINMFDDPNLVISRPIFPVEKEEGLKIETDNWTSVFDEKVPEITKFLDDLFKLSRYFLGRKEHFSHVPLYKSVIWKIGMDYYDCMSGGTSKYSLSILQTVMKALNIDEDVSLYPDGSTVGSFYRSMRKSGINDDIWKHMVLKFQKELPEPMKLITG
jgi:hypothetical protein